MSEDLRYAPFWGNDNLGLYLVQPSTQNARYTCDIIIVHGLNGGPARTWRHPENQVIWFRELLPFTLRDNTNGTNARIWTYGYSANARFSKPVCDMTPIQFAQDLLFRVKAVRDGYEEAHRVIWVCHSLGGIVVKNALVQARGIPEYSDIWSATVGVIFMGTPHHGSSAANVGDVAIQIAKACGASTDGKLLKHLKPNCDSLQTTGLKFAEIASHIKIYSFYETIPQIKDKIIVTSDSAIVNVPNETVVPLNSNHCDMGKFGSYSDPNYLQISYSIRNLMKLTDFKPEPIITTSNNSHQSEGSVTSASPNSFFSTADLTNSSPSTVPESSPNYIGTNNRISVSSSDRRPLPSLNAKSSTNSIPMPQEEFATIIREGNLAKIESAVSANQVLDQNLCWRAIALRYSLEITDLNKRNEIFTACLDAQTARLCAPDSYGNLLIHRIIINKDYEVSYLNALISAGVDLNAPDVKPGRGYRPLHLTVIHNRLDMFNSLMLKKTLINAEDASSRTALWHAVELVDASNSRMQIVQLLIANGGDRAPLPKSEVFESKIRRLYKKNGLKKVKGATTLYCRK